ncbi:MAG: hypothetical protein N3A66_07310 [Planctomycetota bacterium]|nr:hypothetical protein [Planctomycetota bacterium]
MICRSKRNSRRIKMAIWREHISFVAVDAEMLPPFEGVDQAWRFFVCRRPRCVSDAFGRWVVCEYYTGQPLIDGNSRGEAIANAQAILRRGDRWLASAVDDSVRKGEPAINGDSAELFRLLKKWTRLDN